MRTRLLYDLLLGAGQCHGLVCCWHSLVVAIVGLASPLAAHRVSAEGSRICEHAEFEYEPGLAMVSCAQARAACIRDSGKST